MTRAPEAEVEEGRNTDEGAEAVPLAERAAAADAVVREVVVVDGVSF